VRKLTGRSWGVSRASRIRNLNESIRGWMHYFGLSPYSRPLPELEAWLRRRLRRCCWTQGRYVRTKVRELLKLGTAKTTARLTALSRKGPGPLSRTLATQTGLTNQWRNETLGLVSLRALWISLFTIRPQPPRADPPARWCGGWGGRPPWLPDSAPPHGYFPQALLAVFSWSQLCSSPSTSRPETDLSLYLSLSCGNGRRSSRSALPK